MAFIDSQRYPWNLYLINSVEDIVIFLGLKVFDFDNFYMFPCDKNSQENCLETKIKNNQFV